MEKEELIEIKITFVDGSKGLFLLSKKGVDIMYCNLVHGRQVVVVDDILFRADQIRYIVPIFE